jgi:anti-sigma regulatory factor (Ser/Thr protein kinase)
VLVTGRRPLDRCAIRAVVPASFDAIEELFAEFRHCYGCVLGPSEYFAAELLLREALTNAVRHGSHDNPARSVRCALRMKGRRLIIAVGDEGEGFDWRTRQKSVADACACSGRGMEIYRTYANRVRFNSRGNAVTLVMDFDDGVPGL